MVGCLLYLVLIVLSVGFWNELEERWTLLPVILLVVGAIPALIAFLPSLLGQAIMSDNPSYQTFWESNSLLWSKVV